MIFLDALEFTGIILSVGRGGGMVDARDLKSCERKFVRVQIPLSAPKRFNGIAG
jgi:hypothetical protein